jgi:hypothetical protein
VAGSPPYPRAPSGPPLTAATTASPTATRMRDQQKLEMQRPTTVTDTNTEGSKSRGSRSHLPLAARRRRRGAPGAARASPRPPAAAAAAGGTEGAGVRSGVARKPVDKDETFDRNGGVGRDEPGRSGE